MNDSDWPAVARYNQRHAAMFPTLAGAGLRNYSHLATNLSVGATRSKISTVAEFQSKIETSFGRVF